MKLLSKGYLLLFLLAPLSSAFGDVVTCTRSTCEGWEALVYSPKDDPAIACDDPNVCSYVIYYLGTEFLVNAGEEDADDPQTLLVTNRLMKKSGVTSFEEAKKRYRIAPHRQRVEVNIMDFTKDLAFVKPIQGSASYWISFDKLTPVARTSKAYQFDGKVTKGSAVLASLVNSGIGIYGVKSIGRQADAVLPQSFDERISFSLEGYESKGGQIFVCLSKKFCDSIYEYFRLLNSLAGPYLFRSKDGKLVAQLNGSLNPETALSFESALLRVR